MVPSHPVSLIQLKIHLQCFFKSEFLKRCKLVPAQLRLRVMATTFCVRLSKQLDQSPSETYNLLLSHALVKVLSNGLRNRGNSKHFISNSLVEAGTTLERN